MPSSFGLLPLLASALLGLPSPARAYLYIHTTILNETFVLDSKTDNVVVQGSGSDGASAPANTIFAIFALVIGVVVATVGTRTRWRVGCGCAVGLLASLFMWLALVNVMHEGNLASTVQNSDLVIFGCTGAIFLVALLVVVLFGGQLLGWFLFAPLGGGGFGLLAMLMMPTDVVPKPARIVVSAVFAGLAVFGLPFPKTRPWAGSFGAGGTASFLLALGIDLLLNKDAAMSYGLRRFMDNNIHHFFDLHDPYVPKTSTYIISGVFLFFTFPIAYLQHRFHPSPFPSSASTSSLPGPGHWERPSGTHKHRPSLYNLLLRDPSVVALHKQTGPAPGSLLAPPTPGGYSSEPDSPEKEKLREHARVSMAGSSPYGSEEGGLAYMTPLPQEQAPFVAPTGTALEPVRQERVVWNEGQWKPAEP